MSMGSPTKLQERPLHSLAVEGSNDTGSSFHQDQQGESASSSLAAPQLPC
jgi:hypothetical protein